MQHLKNLSRIAGAALLAAAVFACGTDDGAVTVPPALGMRVIYIADSADAPGRFQAYAADTGSTTQQVTKISRHVDADEVLSDPIMSLDERYLGVRVADAVGCRARYEFVDTTTGLPMNTLRGNDHCGHRLEFNPAGGNLALRVTLLGETGPRLVLADTPDADTVFSIDTGITGGTVADYRFSGDGSRIAWAEAGGLFSSTTFTVGSFGQFRSTDTPTAFAVTFDGANAVYVAPGETRFRRTVITPGAALSETYLTAAMAIGDTLGDYALSPDGTQLLYVAVIGGDPQLWLVPLAAPLTEQRVDSAPFPTAGPSQPKFAWNTDGTRFAWFGDAGGSDFRVYGATLAAPTTAVVLTPTGQAPYALLAWSNASTVVYDSYDIGFGLSTLRSVAVGTPLTTVALSPVATLAPGVDALVVCGDGTLVYRYTDQPPLMALTMALYRATALDANSVQRITPWHDAPAQGIGDDFTCAQ